MCIITCKHCGDEYVDMCRCRITKTVINRIRMKLEDFFYWCARKVMPTP